MRTPKRIGDPITVLLAELHTDRESYRSNKLGKADIWWGLKLYRERVAPSRLCAVFYVNGYPVVGLDFHRNSSWDSYLETRIEKGYHWDVYEPLVKDKYKFSTDIESLSEQSMRNAKDPLNIDRAALATMFRLCHIRHERESQTVLKRRH